MITFRLCRILLYKIQVYLYSKPRPCLSSSSRPGRNLTDSNHPLFHASRHLYSDPNRSTAHFGDILRLVGVIKNSLMSRGGGLCRDRESTSRFQLSLTTRRTRAWPVTLVPYSLCHLNCTLPLLSFLSLHDVTSADAWLLET